MSLLDTKVLPKLEGERVATLKSYREVINDKGGYVETILKLEDREYTYNIFPTQLEYVTSALRNQFGLDTEVTLGEVLDIAKTTEFKVWFAYNPQYGRMNVALHAPRVETQEDSVEL